MQFQNKLNLTKTTIFCIISWKTKKQEKDKRWDSLTSQKVC